MNVIMFIFFVIVILYVVRTEQRMYRILRRFERRSAANETLLMVNLSILTFALAVEGAIFVALRYLGVL